VPHETQEEAETFKPMSRYKANTDNYWSPDHQWFLAAIARKVYSRFPCHRFIQMDDLINEAWLHCLRHRPKEKLRGCGNIVELAMADHAITVLTGKSHWMRTRATANVQSFGILTTELIDQYGGRSDRTPLEICIEREENELKCLHQTDDNVDLGKRPARV